MAENIEIRVEPKDLISKAGSVSESIGRMQNRLEEIGNIIRRTESYWIGEAGEQHRKMYFDQEAAQTEIMQRLGRHPNNLLIIAGLMNDADVRLAEISGKRPDKIF